MNFVKTADKFAKCAQVRGSLKSQFLCNQIPNKLIRNIKPEFSGSDMGGTVRTGHQKFCAAIFCISSAIVFMASAQAALVTITANTPVSTAGIGNTDTVLVENGATLQVDQALTCANITLGSNSGGANKGDGTLDFTTASTVILTDSVVGLTLGDGTKNGHLTFSAAGRLQCPVIIAFTGATFTPGTGTVALTAGNTLPNLAAFNTFNNLDVSGGITVLSQSITVSGNLTVQATGEIDDSNPGNTRFITVSGNATINGPISGAANATRVAGLSVTGTTSIGTTNVSVGGTLSLTGAVTQTASTTLLASTLTLGSTFNTGGNDLTLTISNNVNLPGVFSNFGNLTSNGIGGVTLSGTVQSTGAQSYSNAAVTLSAATVIKATAITLPAVTGGGFNLTTTGSGLVTFNGAFTNVNSLTDNGTGTTTIATVAITTTAGQSYNALTINQGTTLTASSVTCNNTVDGGFGLIVTAGTTTFTGAVGGGTPLTSLTVSTGNAATLSAGGVINSIVVSGTGTLTNNGTLTVSSGLSGTGNYVQGSSSVLNFGGSPISVTSFDSSTNTNTVNYNGAAQTVRAVTYSTLQLSGSNTKTLTGVSTINAAFTLSGAASATLASATTTVGGTVTIGAGTTLNDGGNAINVAGNWSCSGTGTFGATTGTVNFNSATATTQTITSGGQSFNNVTKSSALNAVQLQDAFTSSGTVSLTGGGTFDCNDKATSLKNLTIMSGFFTAPNAGFSFTVSGNFDNGHGGTFTPGTGTVTLNGASGTQTLDDGGQSFTNVTHSGAGTLQIINNALNVSGTLTNSAGTLDASGQALSTANVSITGGTLKAPATGVSFTVSGNWSRTAGTFNANGGKVTFNGTTQTITSGGQSFNDIDCQAATSLTTNDALTSAGTLTATNGTFNVSGFSVTAKNVTIAATGALTAPASASFNVSGNWSHATGGTFNANGGTVTFNGASQTISGSTTFDSFTDTTAGATLTFDHLATQTISATGTLTLSGTSGSHLNLISDDAVLQFTISPTAGSQVVAQYLNVTRSIAAPAIICTNCTLVSTVGWNNFNVSNVWVGNANSGSKTDWNNKKNWSANSVPTSTDSVDIPNTANLPTLTAAGFAQSIQVESGASVGTSTFALTVSGNVTLLGTATMTNGAGGTLTLSGGSSTYSLSDGTGTFCSIVVNDSTNIVQLASNITTSGTIAISAGTLDTNDKNLTVQSGTLTVASGCFLKNNGGGGLGTVTINGTGNIGGAGSFTAQNLTIGNGGAQTTTLAGAITVSTDISVTANCTLDDAGRQITGGSGTMALAATSTLKLGSAATATTFPTNFTQANITLNAGSTVIYNSNQAQTISGVPTYSNLTLSSSAAATKTLGAAATVNAALTINSNNTLDDGGFQITGNATGSLSLAATGMLRLGSTGSATLFPTNLINANITLTAGSTVIYNSNQAQTISGVPTYSNLTLSSTAAVTKTLAALTTVNGTLVINANNKLDDGGFQITGNATGSLTVAAAGTLSLGSATTATLFPTNLVNANVTLTAGSTVIYNSNQAQTISGVPMYSNLTLSSSAAVTKTLAASVTANGNVNIGANNTLNATTAGTEGLTVGGNLTANGPIGAATALGFLSVTGTSTLSATPIKTINGVGSGNQTYSSGVTLGATLALSSGTGTIQFSSTVDATTPGVQGLSITSTGSTTFSGAVGATALNSFSSGVGTTKINGGSLRTSGTQTFNGPVTLGVSLATLTSVNQAITFSGTVDGPQGLAISTGGTTTFTGAVGTTALASFSSGSGTTQINGGLLQTTGSQTYNGPVTLGATTALTTTNGAVSFGATATVNGNFDLTVATTTAGTVSFGGAVGGTAALSNLTVNSSQGITLSADMTVNFTVGSTVVFNPTAGGVTETAGPRTLTTPNLLLTGAGTFAMGTPATLATNRVGVLAASVTGKVQFINSQALTIGSVTVGVVTTDGIKTGGSDAIINAGPFNAPAVLTVSKPVDTTPAGATTGLTYVDPPPSVVFTLPLTSATGLVVGTGNIALNDDQANPIPSVAPATGQATTASTSPINYTVSFANSRGNRLPVKGLTLGTFAFGTGPLTVTATVGVTVIQYTVTQNNPPNDLSSYNVAVQMSTAAGQLGTVTVAVPVGLVTDAAQNSNSATASATVTYDTQSPTVTSITRVNSSPTNALPTNKVQYAVQFSKPVFGFSSADFAVPSLPLAGSINPLTGPFALSGFTGPTLPNFTYTIMVDTGSGDGSLSLNVIAGMTLHDLAGNKLAVSTITAPPFPAVPAGVQYDIIKTIPALINITSTTADGVYNAGASINVTVTFNKPVSLTGGNLLIPLNTGATVSISPFANSNTASGTYVVGPNDSSASDPNDNLNVTAPVVSLASGAILKDALNNCILTTPTPNFISKNIKINAPPLQTSPISIALDPNFDPADSANLPAGVALPGQNCTFSIGVSDLDLNPPFPVAGNVLTYSWDFGDGTTGTGAQPVHAYANAGSYSISVKVNDSRGGAQLSATATLLVNTPPQVITPAAPDFNPTGFDTQTTFSVGTAGTGGNDVDNDALVYTWDFGDGTTASGATVTHFFASATFPKNLIASDGTATVNVILTITDPSRGAAMGTVVQSFQEIVINPFGNVPNVTDDIDVTNPAQGSPPPMTIQSKGAKGALKFTILNAVGVCNCTISPTIGVKPNGTIHANAFFALFRQPGVYVVTAIDAAGNIARKMVPITLQESLGGDRINFAFSVDQSFLIGRFSFKPTKKDMVAFRGRFPLTTAQYPTGNHTFVIGLGNVVVTLAVDAKGHGKAMKVVDGSGVDHGPKSLKLFRFKFVPRSGKAVMSLSVSFTQMDQAGFDSSGVIASFGKTGKNGQLQPLNIQVAVLIDSDNSFASVIPCGFVATRGTGRLAGAKK